MKKNLFTLLLSTFLAMNAFAYSGGNGTEEYPYLISSRADMQELAGEVNGGNSYTGKFFQLTRDLTATGDQISIIIGGTFSGTFDGGNHEIYVTRYGLFRLLENATIKNVVVSGTITDFSYTVSSPYNYYYYYYTGGICGYAIASTLINCHNKASISVSGNYRHDPPTADTPGRSYRYRFYTGGICGYACGSNYIANSHSEGSLSASIETRGGTMGPFMPGAPISNFFVYPYSYMGGICGYLDTADAVITKCYNTGILTSNPYAAIKGDGYSYAGGICGYAPDTIVKINNCYNKGNITSSVRGTGSFYSGGICSYRGKIENCFVVDSEIKGSSSTIGRIGGAEGNYSNCYAEGFSVLLNNNALSSSDASSKDGSDCITANLQDQAWLEPNLSWDFENDWKMPGSEQFPELWVVYYAAYQNTTIELSIPSIVYGDQITLNATSNNDVAMITYTSSDTTIAKISGNILTANKTGNVTITASQPEGDNFFAGSKTVELNIGKKELTITANPESMMYGDALPQPYTYQYDGFIDGDSENVLTVLPTLTCSATSQSNVGQYDITPSDAEAQNYTFNYQPGTLTILKRTLTITPTDASRVYGNDNPAFTVSYSGFINGDTEGVLTTLPIAGCTATSQSNAGQYNITASGAEAQNYAFDYQPGTLTILKRTLQATPADASRAYGDADPAFIFSYSGFVNNDTEANITTPPVAVSDATAASPVGNYTITCSGGNAVNYDFNYGSGTMVVEKAVLTVSAVNTARNYREDNPAFAINYSGFKNSETQTVLTSLPQATTTATASSNSGTYPINISGGSADNYTFNYRSGTLTINKIQLTVTANSASSTYGDIPPTYTCQYSGFVNSETESILIQQASLTCPATPLSDAGQYSITPSGAEAQNYTFHYQTGTLTIMKRPLQATPINVSRAYGDANPAFALSYSGFVNGNTVADITQPVPNCYATIFSPVGNYTITCTGGNATNYAFTYGTGTLTVEKSILNVGVDNVTRNYGTANPVFTINYSGFKNAENQTVLISQPQTSTMADINSNAGTYPINISGADADNYLISHVPGTLTIDKAPLTVTALPVTIVYGDTLPAFTCQYNGFVNGETESILLQCASLNCNATPLSDAGQYAIIPSGAEAQNYSFHYQADTLTIQKRSLLATPRDTSRAYGDDNPVFTFSYSGFINGNNIADITTAPTATTTATASSPVGNYIITGSGGSARNYDFNYGTGQLDITKSPLLITANDTVRLQGEANPTFTLRYEGFKNNENENVLDQLPTISCTATEDSPIGSYDIVLSGGSDNNYELQLTNGQLEILEPNDIKQIVVSEIAVYPNPAKHNVYIKSKVPIEKVEVFNSSGVCVLIKNHIANSLDVSALPNGFYLLRIYVKEGSVIRKVIIN